MKNLDMNFPQARRDLVTLLHSKQTQDKPQVTSLANSVLSAMGFASQKQVKVIPELEPMEVDVIQSRKPSPLEIPELLQHILSFLESSVSANSDPTLPVDFVKVDSIKYTISKPKLHACASVSKLWNQCTMELLWKNIKVGTQSGIENLSRTLGSSAKGGQIGRVKSAGNICWGRDASSCKFHDGMVMVPSIANNWIYGHLIKSVSLIPSHGVNPDQFKTWNLDYLVSLIAISCPKLEDLNLSNCSPVTDRSMVLVAKHCYNLKRLNLNRCDKVSTVSIEELSKTCTKLISLNLSRPLMKPATTLSNESVLDLVKANPKLQELRLRNCENLTDSSVVEMCQVVGKSLLALDLSWCGKITDNAIIFGVAGHCLKLKSLAVNGCKKLEDRSLSALLSNCPDICSLSLAHLPFISDVVLTTMAAKLKNLVILSLNGCASVHDASIIALAENCTELKSLSLFSLPITDASVQSISANCVNLSSLSISSCTNVTDAGAVNISNLSKLQSLYLNGSAITDASIVSIAQHCPNIRALSLNECTQLTDLSFVYLAQFCTNIQSLSMNLTQVTAVGVKALVDRCVDLREMSIKDCNQCALVGECSKRLTIGNGGMHTQYAIGEQVNDKIKMRKIAMIYA